MPVPPLSLAAIRQTAFLYGPDGTIAEANDLAEALSGRSLAGRTLAAVVGIFDIRSPDGTPLLAADMPSARALRGEEAVDVPLVVTAADGRTRHILATAAPILNGGDVTGALSIWQDMSIREALRAEAETAAEELQVQREELLQQGSELVRAVSGLDRQQRLLDGILGAMPHHVSLWDRNERLVWANERFAAALGEPREALVGRTWRELWREAPGIAPLVEGALRAVGAGEPFSREVETAGPAGPGWRAVTFLPVFGDQVLVITDEVTARRQAEEALRTSLERLAYAQHAARSGFWDWISPPNGPLSWSAEFYDLFGLDPSAEPSIALWLATIHPDDREAAQAQVVASIAERTPIVNEYRIVLPGGSERWIGTYGETTYDAAGRSLRTAGICVEITERMRAEAALREREQQLTLALEGAGAGMWVRDPDGGWIATPQLNALFGLPHDAPPLREEEFPAFIHPDDLPAITEAWLAGREGCSDYDQEYRVVRPDGCVRWLASKGRMLADIGGRRRFIGITYDITERKQVEEALRTSEARQALLAEVAGRLLAAEEPQAVVDDLCRRALAVLDCDVFFNYLMENASGQLVLNAFGGIPAGEAAQIRRLDLGTAVCGCAARDGCRIVAEAIPENPDPRTDLVAGYGVRAYACHPLIVWGRAIGTLSFGTRTRDRFTDDELATMRAIADLIAVAMQRIADRDALRGSEERLRLAQEGAGIGIWDHDVASNRVTLSPMFLGRYGMTAEAVEHYEDWERLIHPDDRERVEAERRAALVADQPLDLDFRVILPSGDERSVQFRGRGSANGLGGPGRVLGVVIDVTARKRAEDDLRRYTADLRASNEELQRFAYVASHDLQEPLRSIVSFSQLLERRYKGRLDQDADDYIGFIVEGGTRMQALIRDLLQFSRLETQARKPEPTDAGAAVRSVLRTLEATVREGRCAVVVGPLPTVMADPAQLEQVFSNLIGNAIKYRRPDAPLEIAISARRTDRMWEFAVKDNGIGIEPEYYDRIFEMFRRLHTQDKYDGTGIGLAVVKRIVERHGGRIWVESTPDEGSTFFFTLPAA